MRTTHGVRRLARRELRRLKRRELKQLSRREIIKMGLVVSGGALVPWRRLLAEDGVHSPEVRPFQTPLPIPPVHQPVSRFSVGPPEVQCSLEVPGFKLPPPVLYEVPIHAAEQEIIPGLMTEIWGYSGLYPGPTFMVERNKPIVVRFINDLDVELSTHNHGGHTAPHSDGFPNDFFFPGEFRDYCYPNISPEDDDSEFATLQWYHDHAMDITGENVYMGLAGYYLLTDDVEQDLIDRHVLPGPQFDIPLVLQDRLFDSDGSLIYDPMDHDGVIGDLFLANGVVQPKFHVERRKYRFRILLGANARIYALRLSTGQPFIQIGTDSWLLPEAVNVDTLLLSPANRADVVIDFTDAPDEVFMTNHLTYDAGDGAAPEEDLDEPDGWPKNGPAMIKFIVGNSPPPSFSSAALDVPATFYSGASVEAGTPLRPHTPILESEIVRTRTFEFDDDHGAWTINGEFFDPDRDDADPELGTAERWFIINESGGWAHPIHIHLEAHQIQNLTEESPPPPQLAANVDTTLLFDSGAEIFIKFRTFPGRFVFHCHNVEHEDMRMMGVFNVQE